MGDLLTSRISMQALGDVTISDYVPRPLFFQSGYLTLESYDRTLDECTLRIPNGEVKVSLFRFLMGHFTQLAFAVGRKYDEEQMVSLLEQGQVVEFMAKLEEIFLRCDYLVLNKEIEDAPAQEDSKKKAPRERDFQGFST